MSRAVISDWAIIASRDASLMIALRFFASKQQDFRGDFRGMQKAAVSHNLHDLKFNLEAQMLNMEY